MKAINFNILALIWGGIFLTSCLPAPPGQQEENKNPPQNVAWLPVPSLIEIINPSSYESFRARPEFRVGGNFQSYQGSVRLYRNSQCSELLGSAPIVSGVADILTNHIQEGANPLHAQFISEQGYASQCSPALATYIYTPFTLEIDSLLLTADSIYFSWVGHSDAAFYRVHFDGASYDDPASEFFVDSLTQDYDYSFEVEAFDALGNSDGQMQEVSFRTLPLPSTGLTRVVPAHHTSFEKQLQIEVSNLTVGRQLLVFKEASCDPEQMESFAITAPTETFTVSEEFLSYGENEISVQVVYSHEQAMPCYGDSFIYTLLENGPDAERLVPSHDSGFGLLDEMEIRFTQLSGEYDEVRFYNDPSCSAAEEFNDDDSLDPIVDGVLVYTLGGLESQYPTAGVMDLSARFFLPGGEMSPCVQIEYENLVAPTSGLLRADGLSKDLMLELSFAEEDVEVGDEVVLYVEDGGENCGQELLRVSLLADMFNPELTSAVVAIDLVDAAASYGSEDYFIEVHRGNTSADCSAALPYEWIDPEVAGVTLTGVSFHSVEVAWTADPLIDQYDLYYKLASETDFILFDDEVTSPVVLSGLASDTAYDISLVAIDQHEVATAVDFSDNVYSYTTPVRNSLLPPAIEMVEPDDTFNLTPQVRVVGLEAGDVVRIYNGAGCVGAGDDVLELTHTDANEVTLEVDIPSVFNFDYDQAHTLSASYQIGTDVPVCSPDLVFTTRELISNLTMTSPTGDIIHDDGLGHYASFHREPVFVINDGIEVGDRVSLYRDSTCSTLLMTEDEDSGVVTFDFDSIELNDNQSYTLYARVENEDMAPSPCTDLAVTYQIYQNPNLSLTAISPTAPQGFEDEFTFRVLGLYNGLELYIYDDVAVCDARGAPVYTDTVSGSTYDVTLSGLSAGNVDYYINIFDGGVWLKDTCDLSISYDYRLPTLLVEVDASISRSVDLAQAGQVIDMLTSGSFLAEDDILIYRGENCSAHLTTLNYNDHVVADEFSLTLSESIWNGSYLSYRVRNEFSQQTECTPIISNRFFAATFLPNSVGVDSFSHEADIASVEIYSDAHCSTGSYIDTHTDMTDLSVLNAFLDANPTTAYFYLVNDTDGVETFCRPLNYINPSFSIARFYPQQVPDINQLYLELENLAAESQLRIYRDECVGAPLSSLASPSDGEITVNNVFEDATIDTNYQFYYQLQDSDGTRSYCTPFLTQRYYESDLAILRDDGPAAPGEHRLILSGDVASYEFFYDNACSGGGLTVGGSDELDIDDLLSENGVYSARFDDADQVSHCMPFYRNVDFMLTLDNRSGYTDAISSLDNDPLEPDAFLEKIDSVYFYFDYGNFDSDSNCLATNVMGEGLAAEHLDSFFSPQKELSYTRPFAPYRDRHYYIRVVDSEGFTSACRPLYALAETFILSRNFSESAELQLTTSFYSSDYFDVGGVVDYFLVGYTDHSCQNVAFKEGISDSGIVIHDYASGEDFRSYRVKYKFSSFKVRSFCHRIENMNTGCPPKMIPVPANPSIGQNTPFCVSSFSQDDGTGDIDVNITVNAARLSCEGLHSSSFWSAIGDFRLISNREWMTIARNIEGHVANWFWDEDTSENILFTGVGTSAFSGISQKLNVPSNTFGVTDWEDVNKPVEIDPADNCKECRRTHYLSNGHKIWDFAGNVLSWVDYDPSFFAVSTFPLCGPMIFLQLPEAWNKINSGEVGWTNCTLGNNDIRPSNSSLTTDNRIGSFVGTGSSDGYGVRGGSFLRPNEFNGIYTLYLGGNWNTDFLDVGHRCVWRPH